MTASNQILGIPSVSASDLASASGSLEGRNRARFLGIRMDALQRMQFSGLLLVKATQGSQWGLFFQAGKLAWGISGSLPQRRWQRLMRLHCPTLQSEDLAWVQMGSSMEGYMALLDLHRRQVITSAQAEAVILSTVAEVLFDILQESSDSLTYACEADKTLPAADLIPTGAMQTVWSQVQDQWQQWQTAGLAAHSPNGIPAITQPEALKDQVPARVYFTLSRMINGHRTLRDLTLVMKQDLLLLAKSLLPLIQQGLIQIKTGHDLAPAATAVARSVPLPSAPSSPATSLSGLKIACIDDSPFICEQMKQILTAANHQFLGIQDSTLALAQLIEFKPDLIFLDLVMPVASGYEVCAQIRKISKFKNTPVVILTGHDGMVDRVRAKMAGSTDFVTKPVDPQQVAEIIEKHVPVGSESVKPSQPQRVSTRSVSTSMSPTTRRLSAQVSPAV